MTDPASENDSGGEYAAVKYEYPELVESIAGLWDSTLTDGDGEVDMDALADDSGLRAIREAREMCGRAGTEANDRPAVIAAGVREWYLGEVRDEVADLRWQLEVMFGL